MIPPGSPRSLAGLYAKYAAQDPHFHENELIRWARLDGPERQYGLALRYFHGNEVPQNVEKGIQWLKHSADEGYPQARYDLGMRYLQGKDIPQDNQKACEYLGLNPKGEISDELLNLGLRHLHGQDVPLHHQNAVECFMLSAGYGNNQASYEIALLHFANGAIHTGIGWLTRSADDGNPNARYDLGMRHLHGQDVPINHQKACKYLGLDPEKKIKNELYNLGCRYFHDQGDHKRAYECFQQSANQGNDYGIYNLGVMFFNGHYINQNYEIAADYFRQSAYQQNPDAKKQLGKMHLSGQGVTKDEKMALALLQGEH